MSAPSPGLSTSRKAWQQGVVVFQSFSAQTDVSRTCLSVKFQHTSGRTMSCTYAHACTHVCIHAYMHTYIHTYMLAICPRMLEDLCFSELTHVHDIFVRICLCLSPDATVLRCDFTTSTSHGGRKGIESFRGLGMLLLLVF